MAALTEKMKSIFNNQSGYVFATSSKEGIPNSVPVNAVKLLDDETILVSDQFLNKTLANIKENPLVSICFWEMFEGYQIKGEAKIFTDGKIYEETAAWIKAVGESMGFPLRSKGAIVIKIKEIYSVSPGPEAGKKLS